MKKLFLLSSLVAAAMFTACSNDDPVNPGTTNPDEEGVYGDSYLSVSFLMPTSVGGRAEGVADNDNDKYEDGEPLESKVNNVFFFFFDSKDNVIDIQKFENIDFENKNPFNPNPYVTSFGTTEIRLKSGLDYAQVAVAINSSVASANDFRGIKTLSDLENHGHEYLSNLKKPDGNSNNWGFVMSNSVYYDALDKDGNSTYTNTTVPSEADKVILVPITEKNIYKSTDRKADGSLPDGYEYVDIFVERVLAKVEVSSSLNMEDYYASDVDGVKSKSITIYNNTTLTTKKVNVKPVILGVSLNVLTKEAKLIKPILANQVGYDLTAKNYNAFRWNDPLNKRSYWANTETFPKEKMSYCSWNTALGKNVVEGKISTFTQYIHPNTQNFEPTAENENNSLNTKVMVVAKLQGTDLDENGNEVGNPYDLDIVRYGAEYMEKNNFLAHVANLVTIKLRSEDWSEEDGFTAAEKAILDVVLINSLADKTDAETNVVTRVITSDMFKLTESSKDSNNAYEAIVSTTDKYGFTLEVKTSDEDFFKYSDDDLKKLTEKELAEAEARNYIKDKDIAAILMSNDKIAALNNKANTQLNKDLEAALSSKEKSGGINEPQILYWKEGMTYFYTTIKQQGFYGLVGGADNYLNGVVRNHVYYVDLNLLYGLGTPVIDPTKDIDPERPEIKRPNYLQARINVLPWRIVKNEATIH